MTEEVERRVVIANELGLHARPAAMFVQSANNFKSKIILTKDDMVADAKSIMEVMMLGAERGSVVVVKAKGPDAQEAVQTLAEMLESNLE